MRHPHLSNLNPDDAIKEITDANDVFKELTGHYPLIFREPYGISTSTTDSYLAEHDIISIRWSIDIMDWKCKKEEPTCALDKLKKRLSEKASVGGIVLMHEYENTLAYLEDMIVAAKESTFELGSLALLFTDEMKATMIKKLNCPHLSSSDLFHTICLQLGSKPLVESTLQEPVHTKPKSMIQESESYLNQNNLMA
eukprot:CAMPEP_0117422218 /NCGR_PEP_ID=MMETSP0758-20121206/3099_1 /TAXON_ID=63605 /ORGANISM="Percolomonas cosmopolitus, Strain AE-1 (ATCC 50343)" /LENGTH=195 /DNA_ID=CAMNT_0005204701 /DNA_START=296 /DNA_END=880 /DNA_ORIENTATION=+